MATPEGNLPDLQANLKIDDFQLQLSNLKKDGYTHNELLLFLQEKGIHISDRTLKRRLQIWGVPSRCRPTEVDLNSGDRADELARCRRASTQPATARPRLRGTPVSRV